MYGITDSLSHAIILGTIALGFGWCIYFCFKPLEAGVSGSWYLEMTATLRWKLLRFLKLYGWGRVSEWAGLRLVEMIRRRMTE